MSVVNSVQLAPSNSVLSRIVQKKGRHTMSPVKANTEVLKAENEKADAVNKTRTGVGLRVFVGQTRGKSPSVVTWEAFDKEKTDTLPKSIAEFMALTGTKDEPDMVDYLIEGFNKAAYSAASDEIGEFVNDEWSKELAGQFRIIVRQYFKALGGATSLEDIVNMVKPAIEKAHAAKSAQPTT